MNFLLLERIFFKHNRNISKMFNYQDKLSKILNHYYKIIVVSLT